ncbi:GumC family protein [Bacteroidota bacterium]
MEAGKFDYHNESDINTLKDYINLIRLNLFPIILITLTGLVVAVIYALNARDIYKSTTAIKLSKPQGGSILSAPLIPEFQEWGSDRFVANEIEILKSYRLREVVAQSLIDIYNSSENKNNFYLLLTSGQGIINDQKKLRSPASLTDLLAGVVNIEQKRGLDFVDISIESPSAIEAALIANTYAEAYRDLNLSYNRQQLILVKEFLADQREEKLNQLANAEETLKNYQEKKGIIELPEQASALIQILTDFESKKNATKVEMTITEKSLNQYRNELANQNPRLKDYLESFATEPYIKSLQQQIAQLESQKDLALANNRAAQREAEIVSEYDNRIEELKSKLNEKIEVYKAGIFASSPEEIKQLTQLVLESEVKYQALVASYNEWSQLVYKYEVQFNELPTKSIDLARLQREKVAFEKLYQIIEEKYQEALINEQSTPGNVLIIDTARIPLSPSKPNRNMIIIVGLVLGLGLGFAYAFIKDYFDTTIKTPEDLQNKNVNVLAWIPQIAGLGANNKEFEFIVAKKPDSTISEAFRALRTRIKFSKLKQDGLRTILLTSPASQEGKTLCSVNLAGSFAHANNNTVIIDCDLRKPRIHSVFNDKRHPGFTDYFFGQNSIEEIIRKSEITNLSYITAGTIPPNPSEILGSPQMLNFLDKLKSIYDIIIIDSPPLIAVTDSEILSRIVDGAALVISANYTEMDMMQKAVQLLDHEDGTFLGTVLNNFSYRPGYSSYYKYYYYYSRPGLGKTVSKA